MRRADGAAGAVTEEGAASRSTGRRLLGIPVSLLAFAAPPVAWMGVLLLDYVGRAWACAAGAAGAGGRGGGTVVLGWPSLGLALVTLAAAGGILWTTAAVRDAWRELGTTERPGEPGPEGRRGFIAFGGLFFGTLFLFGTLVLAPPLLLLECGGAP